MMRTWLCTVLSEQNGDLYAASRIKSFSTRSLAACWLTWEAACHRSWHRSVLRSGSAAYVQRGIAVNTLLREQ